MGANVYWSWEAPRGGWCGLLAGWQRARLQTHGRQLLEDEWETPLCIFSFNQFKVNAITQELLAGTEMRHGGRFSLGINKQVCRLNQYSAAHSTQTTAADTAEDGSNNGRWEPYIYLLVTLLIIKHIEVLQKITDTTLWKHSTLQVYSEVPHSTLSVFL